MSAPLPSGLTDTWAWALALLLVKATLVLCAAALAARALRHGSAARRHLAWTLALGALLVLPFLALALPAWKLSFLRIVTLPAVRGMAEIAGPAAPAELFSAGTLLAMVWAAGAAAVLARMAFGWRAVRRMARGAVPMDDPRWTDTVRMLGESVGVRGSVRLVRGEGAAMPVTWGVFRPTILLPAAADEWAAERRRVVLLHELAHVARRDCLTQMLATLCCAVYWFHPGAWWAARRMRVEREEACDDRVLAAGARASDYAGHLVEVARTFRLPRPAAPAMAMARGGQLQARVLAVLDAGRDRRAVPHGAGLAVSAAVLAALLPLAVVGPSERERAPASTVASAPALSGPVKHVELDGMHIEVRMSPAPAPRRAPAPPTLAAAPAPAPATALDALPARQPVHRNAPARALAALIRATTDPEADVRRTAIRALGKLQDDAVVTPLVRSLRDRDSEVRTLAARMLGELAGGHPAPDAEPVATLAEAPRRPSRLGDAAADRAAEALRISLADEDPRVRDTALWALGAIGGADQRGVVILGGQAGSTTGVETTFEGPEF
ncbi:MAG TPA: M56 family metallopeptidase [Longimicrobium sp.]|jgi:beta-lactamase regulating signal transducer with metallopeptidase domain